MGCAELYSANASKDQNRGVQDHSHWYAIYTYPRHERSVAAHLESQALNVYLPTMLTESRWKDRTVRLEVPLFPSYVFIRIRLDQRNKVLGAAGVVRILCFNGAPAPIENSEIEALKLCLERGAAIERCSPLGIGDRVRVRSGALQGLVGQISRVKNDRRLIVPITLIHQSIAIEIDVDLLEPVDESPQPASSEMHAS